MFRGIFISFSDDYIRFMYLYLLTDKFEVLHAFNAYKEEEEKQHEDHKILYRQRVLW
jgi:phage-related protein